MRLLRLTVFTTTALSFALVQAEISCDDPGAMPNQMRVNKKGHPMLSCTRPACTSGALPCTATWITGVCDDRTEYTAGLREINQGDYNTLETKCCKMDSRLQITSISTVTLRSGGNFLGVEESRDGGPVTAFELVKEVYRQTDKNNSIHFVITVAQMECVSGAASAASAAAAAKGQNGNGVLDRDSSLAYAKKIHKKPDNTPKSINKKPSAHHTAPSAAYRQLQHPRNKVHAAAGFNNAEDAEVDGLAPNLETVRHLRAVESAEKGGANKEDDDYIDDEVLAEVSYSKTAPASPPIAPSQPTSPPVAPSRPAPPVVAAYQEPKPAPISAPTYSASSMSAEQTAPEATYSGPAPQPAPIDSSSSAEQTPLPGDYSGPPQQDQQQQQGGYAQPQPPQQGYDQGAQQQQGYAQPQPDPGSYAQPQQQYASAQATQQGYYPSGCETMAECMQCFSGDMKVQTTEGLKKMKDIKIGDMVLSHEENMISYSPVIMFLHRLPEQEATFRVLRTDKGHELKLTEWHLVYTVQCDAPLAVMVPVHAVDVKVGQCLAVNMDGVFKLAKVIEIDQIEAKGIYAPLTGSGDIVVNGILASCHSNVNVQGLQQSFFGWMHIIKDWFGMPMDIKGNLPSTVETMFTAMEWIMPAKAF